MARVDPRVESFAHLTGAKGGIVVALAHLDANLLGADRGRVAGRQRLEGRAAGGVGIDASVDLAIDPGLVQPGYAGDGADLGIGLGAIGCTVSVRNGALAALHIVVSCSDVFAALSSACRLGHLCLHANMGAGVGGRRHQGNLVGRPAHGGQHARAVLGGLGPVLDGVADRDMAQDARQHVLPDRLHLGPGRELDDGRAVLAVHGSAADGAQHVAHGGLAVRVEHAGAFQARQVHGIGREAQPLDVWTRHVAAAHGRAGGPDHLDGAGLRICGGGRQRRATGEQFHGVSHRLPPSAAAPPSGRSQPQPLSALAVRGDLGIHLFGVVAALRDRLGPALEPRADRHDLGLHVLHRIDVVELRRQPFAAEICLRVPVEVPRGQVAGQHREPHEPLPDRAAEQVHHHVVLQLLDAAAKLDQPRADRGIGDALQVARDQLVGQAQPGRDGAQVVLHEGRVGVVLGGVREADVGAGRQRDQAAGLHAHGQRAAGVGAREPARRAVGIGDEAGEQRRDLGLHQRGVLELVELVQPQQHRREPGDPAQLTRRERLEQVQAIGGGDAERVHAERPQRIARAGGQDPVGDPATGGIELDARADPRPAADLAVQVHGNLLAIQKLEVEGNAGGVAHHAQPGEALAALDHRAHGHGLQPVEIRQTIRGGVIGPAQPERLQPLAHRPVGMGGLRLDPGADDIADQAVHRRRDPRVVPRIPPGPPRRRGRAREHRRVQPVDRPRPLPTPPATRGVEAASAREAE